MPVTGSDQLRAVARDLRAAGDPAAGLRRQLRRNLTAAVAPMVKDVQRNAFAIPTGGKKSTGLRAALMRATRARILTAGKNVTVGVITDASKMPAGQETLPVAMEGDGKQWRHPVFGDRKTWVDQPSHPYMAPAIPGTLARTVVAVNAAVDATASALSKGTP